MTEFRWLIEAPGQQYLGVKRLGLSDRFTWTKDHNKALAFRDREQASAVMMALRESDRDYNGGKLFAFEQTVGDAQATEHGWL